MLCNDFKIAVFRKQLMISRHRHDGNQAVWSRCTVTACQALISQAGGPNVVCNRRQDDREGSKQSPLKVRELLRRANAAQYFLENDAWKTQWRFPGHQTFNDSQKTLLVRPRPPSPEDSRKHRSVEQNHRARRSRL